MQTKTTRFFSKPLMKQNIKSNWVLIILIMLVMVMMCNVMTYAMSIMGTKSTDEDLTEYQGEFYSYLGGMATLNTMTGSELSYDDFMNTEDKTAYENAFTMLNTQMNEDFSVDGFQSVVNKLKDGETSMDNYVKQFEYNYALMQSKGCFSGENLTAEGMMNVIFEMMGIDSETVEKMGTMDSSVMLNQMYYTVMGLLPIFLLIVLLGNSVVVNQVDKGSMAYVLSTPTKRSAVAVTQMIFMIIVPLVVLTPVCISKIAATNIFTEDVNVPMIIALYAGMYVLVEAVAAICYMGSCIFNRSRNATAFGGGLAVWFFLASLLGMFGSDMMLDMGMGVEILVIFNKLTLVGLYDVNALSTVGTSNVDMSFLWKLGILIVIAIACYAVGAIKFKKKDLPL